jgi:hypothetical protein
MLQASSLALIGMLTVVGCGGSDTVTKQDAAKTDTLQGEVYTPQPGKVTVAPAFLDFQTVDVGASSTAQTIKVDVSGAAVAISPTIVGAGFALAGNTCTASQAAGTSCNISVKFAPTTVGAANGVLTIGGATVSLSGTGNQPGVFTAPDRIELGTLKLNATAAVTVQIAPQGTVQSLSCTSSSATELAPNAAATTCPATGPVSAACVYAFTFTASTAGLRTDTVTCSGGGKVTQTAVTATVVGPAVLAVSQSSALFNAVVGKTDAVVITVSNNGGSATVAAPTATVSAGTTDFAVTANDCVVALAPLATCKVTVTFAPKTAGAKPGTLTVTDSVTTLPVTLTGTAVADRNVAITPNPADFASVSIGSSKPLTFTMKNTGGTATGLITLSGGTEEFKIGSDQCSGTALAATNGQCTFVVTFAPVVPASTTARATIVNASDAAGVVASVKVSGIATAAPTGTVLSITPPTLDFGTIGVGTTAGPKVFTVTNTGDADSAAAVSVVKNDSTSSVGGASQFTYTTTCTGVVAVGASCQVVVTFAPTIKGSASATITVTDGAVATKPSTVVGIALDKPGLEIYCPSTALAGAPYDFSASGSVGAGGTVVGVASPTVLCVVKNNAASTQASGALTAGATGDFAVATTGNTCTDSLAPGLSCTLQLGFKPTVKGSRTGTLTVTGANGGAANVNLSGTGLGVVELVELGTTCTLTPVPGETSVGYTVSGSDCTAKAQPYDFGQVSVGATSSASKKLTIAVFVRSAVGTLQSAQTVGTPADFTVGTPVGNCPAAGASVTVGALPTTNATAYCYYVVDFSPKSKTAKNGSVALTGANGATDSATFTGTGTGPLTIAPSPVAFSTVAVGTSVTITLTVTNNSASTNVTGASYTLAGTNAADFVIIDDQVTNATIASGGGTKAMTVRFIPSATGARTASIAVSGTFGAVTETASVDLTGTGGTPAQLTAVLNGAIPAAPINGSSVATITVTNGGAVATSNILYSVTSGTEFTITPPTGQTQGTCGATNSTPLAPAATCTIKVWFKPTAGLGIGSRNGTLRVSAVTGGSTSVDLSANATAHLTISPATIQDFGKVVLLDSTSASKTFTVTNNGDAAVSVTVAAVQNVNSLLPSSNALAAAQYLITNNCTAAIDGKGGTCTFSVQFVPTPDGNGVTYGTVYGTLLVTETTVSPNQTASVDVSGTGQNPASLSFTAGTAFDRNFGQVRLGTTSASITFTLQNTGDVPSSTLSYSLIDVATGAVHPKAPDFVMTGTTCPTDSGLAAGATCNIVIAFNPTICSTGSCTTTDAVDVRLVVKATSGAPTGGVIAPLSAAPEIKGTVTTAALPILVENTSGKSPFALAASASAVTTTLALKAGSGSVAIASTDTVAFADLAAAGTVDSTGEFTLDATAGTNTCIPPSGTNTLAANGTCLINVIWTPGATVGKREATVTLKGATATLVAVRPRAAVLVATPAAGLDFGTLLQGTSATMTLTVKNTGDLATTGNLQAAKAGTNAGDVTVLTGGCLGSTLAAGASCALSVKVTPSSIGTGKAATVTVSATGATSSSAMGVTWVGLVPAQLTVNPTSNDFGNVQVGVSSAVLTVAISSVDNAKSSGPLSISVDSTDFTVTAINPAGGSASTDCAAPAFANGLSGAAGTGTTCNIFVTFKAKSLTPAAKTATLTVASTSSAQAQVVLSATAKAAIVVDSASYTFAATTVGQSSATRTFTFTNATNAPTTGALTAALGGAGASQFRIITDNCTGTTLTGAGDATSSCTVIVRFDPTSAGVKAATLTVSGTPGDSAAATLGGTGTNS